MKSLQYLSVLSVLAQDMASTCGIDPSADLETVRRRTDHEGISFLTISLPKFGKQIFSALETGWLDSTTLPGFRFRGGLPIFLGGPLSHVFGSTGLLRLDACTACVRYIRQFCLVFEKIELDCSPERVEAAFDAFVESDNDVRQWENTADLDDLARFSRMALLSLGPVFHGVQKDFKEGNLTPRHGPGATADRLVGNQKFTQNEWTWRLEESFPAADWVIPNHRYAEHTSSMTYLDPWEERPVRVITVPKTLSSPRIIAIEPTAMQYAQQALMKGFVKHVEDYTSSIGFTRQEPNQVLALNSSESRSHATLDLSEASDRVSNLLVRQLFKSFPTLGDAVQDCRSLTADVAGREKIYLSRFASMGSALTFPIEAMVFHTIVLLGIERHIGKPMSLAQAKSHMRGIRVYGDDIIVPTEYAEVVARELELFGLKVNRGKSYWKGFFRESCGVDAFKGEEVTPIRARQPLDDLRRSATAVASWVSFRNQCYTHGYWKTARWLDNHLARVLGSYPTIHPSSELLGRHTFLEVSGERMCEDLHHPLVKGWKLVSKAPENEISGVAALQKVLLPRDLPFEEENHLTHSGRPLAVRRKRAWARPY